MTNRETMILSIQAKTDSCIESYMRRRDLASVVSGKNSIGRSCPKMVDTFDRETAKAKKAATYMVCTWLAWHRTDLDLDYIAQLVIDAGHDPMTVGAMRERMAYCRDSGPTRECP